MNHQLSISQPGLQGLYNMKRSQALSSVMKKAQGRAQLLVSPHMWMLRGLIFLQTTSLTQYIYFPLSDRVSSYQ